MTSKRVFDFGRRSDYIEFFDDFQHYEADDWTLTTVEAGVGSATEALGDARGGVLVITNDAADDDSDFFQWPDEAFQFVAGKRLMFRARFKVSDATQSDFVMGLQITDTTPLAVSDGIYFRKDDGDANLDFVVMKDSTDTTATAVATVEDDTYMTLEFYYDGGTEIDIFVDDAAVGAVAITNAPDDEAIAVSFGIQNGEAVAKIMSVDYIHVVAER